ncbi:AbrB/MazE/SpoVT family DNA-binding domain-containing protein [Leifsonia sp. Root112D2]|jgi:antitoxin MazE|uniref:AbrB/MazE/SpoVT family DNA-binding domain-containing protein n=1 Tax=Leifsonia sp. Root112D2 TaxID=1736426 RepID=UPI0006FAE5B5|nr:AbrB/MazE/SpoVT family DNA-binding domain-containing protein [Leifsonia sp. Root112D2]KQV07595.1 hypothetical protein ASC63_10160 [Leifsonia sp. Root112D2]
MKAKIVRIGNSQGVRIPRALLESARLRGDIEMSIVDDGILLSPVFEPDSGLSLLFMSQSALSDWEKPEEDAAWAGLQ